MTTEFQKQQFERIYPTGIEKHYWNHSRNIHIKDTLTKFKLKNRKILEIGCGRGVVVNYLRQKGFNCTGVELGLNPIDDKTDYLLYNTNALELPEAFRSEIEVILLLDVIEHIQSPTEFLKEIKEAYPNAQHYLITVPSRQEIWSNFDEFNKHFLRYDINTLLAHTNCLEGKTLYMRYLYKLLYLPAILLKKLNRNRSTDIKAPTSAISIAINAILKFYFVLENRIKLGKIPGTSLIQLIQLTP